MILRSLSATDFACPAAEKVSRGIVARLDCGSFVRSHTSLPWFAATATEIKFTHRGNMVRFISNNLMVLLKF